MTEQTEFLASEKKSTEQVCPTCEALFINGVHHWAWNRKVGNAHDLAGLVCNPHSNGRTCINPCIGSQSGDTWAKRKDDIDCVVPPVTINPDTESLPCPLSGVSS